MFHRNESNFYVVIEQKLQATYGLSQGSILGSLIVIVYTSEIGSLLTATSELGHLYADDVQSLLHCLAAP